ncbi:MAG: glycosyltransferase, partial [Planctomycetota bacterium]
LLKLAHRYKVFAGRLPTLEGGFDAMKQAKIVIHCPSIQGGVNLRPFEAVACGALLLHDEGDRSIEEFFEPDKEVVLFNEENFEQKIEYYLHHDTEREQIIQRAMVKNRTYGDIVALMKNTLDKIQQSGITVTSRPASALADDMKLNALGISSFYAKDYHLAAFRFSEAIKMNEWNGKYYNNLAVCLMVQAFTTKQRNPMIEPMLLLVNKKHTPTILSVFNLQSYYRFIQFNPELFLEISDKMAQDLQNNRVEMPVFVGDELFFYLDNSGDSMPESYVFVLELESLLNSFPDRGSRYQEGFLKTVLWRILEYRGDYYEKSGDDSRTIREYKAALEYCPQNEVVLEKLGKLCASAGRLEDAELYLTRLLQLSPFHENAHLWLSKIEWDKGEKGKIKERISCLLHVTALKNQEQFNRIMDKVV